MGCESECVCLRAFQTENRFFEPDPSYLFLHWITPQTGQRRQSSVMTLQKMMIAFDTVPTFRLNPNHGFNPGIIHAA